MGILDSIEGATNVAMLERDVKEQGIAVPRHLTRTLHREKGLLLLLLGGALARPAAGAAPLPIAFEPLADGSGYLSRGDGYNIVLTRRGADIVPRGIGGVLHVTLEGARGRTPVGRSVAGPQQLFHRQRSIALAEGSSTLCEGGLRRGLSWRSTDLLRQSAACGI